MPAIHTSRALSASPAGKSSSSGRLGRPSGPDFFAADFFDPAFAPAFVPAFPEAEPDDVLPDFFFFFVTMVTFFFSAMIGRRLDESGDASAEAPFVARVSRSCRSARRPRPSR